MPRNIASYEYQKEWRKNNPERVRAAWKAWRAAHPGYWRPARLRELYGISSEDYDQMLIDQGGVCALCKSDDPKRTKRLHVDHDHRTGKIRGLLCFACNRSLGWVEKMDRPEVHEYLRRGL